MSDKPMPCPFCGSENIVEWKRNKSFAPMMGCGDCGASTLKTRWNRRSSIPRAQIEAMESEMRHLSEVIVSANTEAYKDTLNTFSDRLSSLLHPELKGEDKL